jgi:NADH-quinone oxidoreductase subunit F
VSGHCQEPGVYEVEFGVTTFRDIIYDARFGGGIRRRSALKAFIPGGASAPGSTRSISTCRSRRASSIGPGRCSAREPSSSWTRPPTWSRRACGWCDSSRRESCGKCTPCREGTTWLERILDRILDGHGRPEDVDLLMDVADNISVGLPGRRE